jgi:hypothetical protein
VHRQGQGQRTLRVRSEGFHRHQQPPGSRWTVRAPRQGAAQLTLRDVLDRTETLTGCSIERARSTRDTAATTRKIPVASSSPARSAASSVSSSASCAAVATKNDIFQFDR